MCTALRNPTARTPTLVNGSESRLVPAIPALIGDPSLLGVV
jgi:hypothetical protein